MQIQARDHCDRRYQQGFDQQKITKKEYINGEMTVAVRLVPEVLVLLVILSRLVNGACPAQGSWALSSGKCYRLITSTNAVAAPCSLRRQCWDLGGELVSVESEAEEISLLQLVTQGLSNVPQAQKPKHLLIGLTDVTTEGTFEWLDGTAVTHTRWKSGSPDNGGGPGTQADNCAAIEAPSGVWDIANTAWIDVSCCFNELGITMAMCKTLDDSFAPPASDFVTDFCYGNCPEGWWTLTGTDRCYTVMETNVKNHEKARHACREYGGDLPVLDTQAALDLALVIIRSSNKNNRPKIVFLGLTDLASEGNLQWTNGDPFVSGSQMSVIEDDVSNIQNCVAMVSSDTNWLPGSSTITWEDTYCCHTASTYYQVLCERSLDEAYDLTMVDDILRSCLQGKNCPRGSLTYAGYCYNYFRDTMTFDEAEAVCSATDGSHLASIVGSIEQSYMEYNFQQTEVWIGLTDRAAEGQWVWTDKSPYSFNRFSPGQPDQLPGDGDCVSVDPNSNKEWKDIDCATDLSFVCKRKEMFNISRITVISSTTKDYFFYVHNFHNVQITMDLSNS